METDDETIVHLELELITLKKFIQKINLDLSETQKRVTAEELFEFFRDRIRYRVSFYLNSSNETNEFFNIGKY
jgi:hypothetical protein